MNRKQKNITLLIGFLTMLFLTYRLAIRKTILAKRTYADLQKEKKLLDNASQKILFLQQKNHYLDSLLKQRDVSIHNSFQQTLLKKINDFSLSDNQIEIQSFNQPHIYTNNQITKETYMFSMKGSFMSILRLVNHIEQQRLGEIISIDFEKKKNYNTRKNYLIVTVYLQRIKN